MDSNQNAYKGMVFVFIFFSDLLIHHFTMQTIRQLFLSGVFHSAVSEC